MALLHPIMLSRDKHFIMLSRDKHFMPILHPIMLSRDKHFMPLLYPIMLSRDKHFMALFHPIMFSRDNRTLYAIISSYYAHMLSYTHSQLTPIMLTACVLLLKGTVKAG